MESATVPKTSHRVVGRLTHVAFLRVPSPFLNPDKVANHFGSIPALQKTGANRRRVPCCIEESRAVRSHLEVSPNAVRLNRLAQSFALAIGA